MTTWAAHAAGSVPALSNTAGQLDEARSTVSESTTKGGLLMETPPWAPMPGVSARGGDAPVDMAAGGGRGPKWSAYGRPAGTGAR